ncbi:FecR family protein [Pontibacter sp. 13R65]|uniref:FecR family protein n=1 Tax=Pontibacter sp. 13R65 TaxID=3127458 RepID=UPI00301D40CD
MNISSNLDIPHELLIRVLSGEANAEEKQLVQEWLQADAAHQAYFQELSVLWNSSANSSAVGQIDTAGDWQKVRSRIRQQPVETPVLPLHPDRAWLTPLLKVAASIVLVLSIALGFSPDLRQRLFNQQLVVTATNGQQELLLPDGTKVYLNRNARLTYSKAFTGGKREVHLKGEAFFEVAKDPDKPFEVTSGAVVTQVLGTSFNINATAPDTVAVTVVTGKVAVFAAGNEQERLLMLPGESSSYQSGTLRKATEKDLNFLAWKTNSLIFRNTPLPQVLKDLNKHYHVSLQLSTNNLQQCELTSTFEQQSLEEVLEEIALVLPITVERSQTTILISGKGC